MSFVNNEDIDYASSFYHTYDQFKWPGSCFVDEWTNCKDALQICCLDGVRDSGTHVIFTPKYLVSPYDWAWTPGDDCVYVESGMPYHTHRDRRPSNMHTYSCKMVSRWSPSCAARYELSWSPLRYPDPGVDSCSGVDVTLKYLVGSRSFTTTATVDRLWPLTGFEMDDPYYLHKNDLYPDEFPLPCAKITFGNCPVPTVLTGCPAPEDEDDDPVDDPDDCSPGCWPECVMCPERKSLYLVIDGDPDCCLAGTYGLTWTGTGTSGYYSLSSPTGSNTDSCGLISAFTVTCFGATHIHVSITYRVIYAPSLSAVTESYYLSVSCSGGHMESEAVSYTLSADQDGLCGSGSDYGGTIRVVSD